MLTKDRVAAALAVVAAIVGLALVFGHRDADDEHGPAPETGRTGPQVPGRAPPAQPAPDDDD